MKITAISILAASLILAGAILYGTGALDAVFKTEPPFALALKDRFTDPESVQIRKVVEDRSGFKWCGEVNARNRMGGYAGWQRFVALDTNRTGGTWRITLESELGSFSGNLLGCVPK